MTRCGRSSTISLDEARRIIDEAVRPIERDGARRRSRTPTAACWRTRVVATADVPPFARAAMDGYAVRADDTARRQPRQPRRLQRIETLFTGQMPTRDGRRRRVHRGGHRRADAGGRRCRRDGRRDRRPGGGAVQRLRQRRGRDRTSAARARTSAQASWCWRRAPMLDASRIGAMAALGLTRSTVYARPRVAILSTGNEIVEPGRPLAPGPDLRHQQLHAGRRRRRARRRAGGRTAPRPTPSTICRARSTSAWRTTCWCSPAAARWARAT